MLSVSVLSGSKRGCVQNIFSILCLEGLRVPNIQLGFLGSCEPCSPTSWGRPYSPWVVLWLCDYWMRGAIPVWVGTGGGVERVGVVVESVVSGVLMGLVGSWLSSRCSRGYSVVYL